MLTLSTLGKRISRRHFEYFSYFFQKQAVIFHVNCLQKTVCMKCHSLFSLKNKKDIISLSSAENAQRVVEVKKLLWDCTIISPQYAYRRD